jgi:hypothetical protein
MDIQTRARLSALELLTTELFSAHLITVAASELDVSGAIDRLCNIVDAMPIGNDTAKDIATLREAAKNDLSRILKAALAQAKQVDRQRWDTQTTRETEA